MFLLNTLADFPGRVYQRAPEAGGEGGESGGAGGGSGGGSGSAGGSSGGGEGSGAAKEPPAPKLQITQAELDDLIESRLARDRAAREADDKKKAAATAADAAKKAGEWETLAKGHETRIAELEPQAAELVEYRASVEALLKVQRQGLPKHILSLLDQLSPAKQLAYIAENAEALAGEGTEVKGRIIPLNPKAQRPAKTDVIDTTVTEMKKSGSYGF